MTEDAKDDGVASAIERLAREALGASVRGREPIAAGLGTRRFERLRLDGLPGLSGLPDRSDLPGRTGPPATAIARIDAPEDPRGRPSNVAPEPALEPIRAFLEAAGLPVPRAYARDAEHGIALLEDLGDETLETLAANAPAEERRARYAAACELIPRLQRLTAEPGEVPAFGRRLDAGLFAYKAEQLQMWLLPRLLGRAPTAAERDAVDAAFGEIRDEAMAAPQRLAHRDLKAQNLHVVPELRSPSRLVMIDIQGAFLAPPEYDLVCLLHDLHVALPAEEIAEHCRRTRVALPDAPPPEVFGRRFTLLTLSRVGKDLSRFLYAVHERGDARYRRFLPNGARLLASAAARAAGWSPALARLGELLEPAPERWPEAACAR